MLISFEFDFIFLNYKIINKEVYFYYLNKNNNNSNFQ